MCYCFSITLDTLLSHSLSILFNISFEHFHLALHLHSNGLSASLPLFSLIVSALLYFGLGKWRFWEFTLYGVQTHAVTAGIIIPNLIPNLSSTNHTYLPLRGLSCNAILHTPTDTDHSDIIPGLVVLYHITFILSISSTSRYHERGNAQKRYQIKINPRKNRKVPNIV